MFKVVTTEEMQRIEKAADAGGLSYDEMMSNAGLAIAEAIINRWLDLEGASALILVGPGNNGGDGLVVGHHLVEAGAKVHAYLSHNRSAEDDHNYERLSRTGTTITFADEDTGLEVLTPAVREADLIVDALLGTGIKLPLRGTPKEILSAVKTALREVQLKPYIVAVDCPSGLDCDTGEIAGESLSADLTVTLAAAKPGLFEFPGAAAVGELEVGSIGISPDQPEINGIQHLLAEETLVRDWLPDRPLNAHKGTFGSVMAVAGSINYPGAAVLAALGAYRSGAGLVTLAVPSVIQSFLVAGIPEATWLALPHEMGVIAQAAAGVLHGELDGVDALLIGPGFGREPNTKLFLMDFLGAGKTDRSRQIGFVSSGDGNRSVRIPPTVIDADGLKLLSEIDNWNSLLLDTAVLTPHPGEFAMMTGLSIAEILADRTKHVRDRAQAWGHVIVLKGAFTLIAAPDGRMATIPIATPALATAGTGDVLAGVILSLRGQGLEAFEAAVVGAYLHARAGEVAADDMGADASVIASDVAGYLPFVLAELTDLY